MIKRRLAAAISLAMAVTLAFGVTAPAVAAPTPKPSKSMTDAEKDLAFNSLLDQLVAKGVVTPAQAEAIATAMRDKRTERQAKMNAFAAKADVIIAEVLGLTVEKFRELRATRTLPKLTPEQKSAMKTKLKALADSLGLPKPTKTLGK